MKKCALLAAAAILLISTNLMAGDFKGSIKMGLFESETKAMKQIKVPMCKAIEAAKAAVPGQVVEAEAEEEDGYLVYKIKILQPDGKKGKIYVDPVTGKILGTKLKSD